MNSTKLQKPLTRRSLLQAGASGAVAIPLAAILPAGTPVAQNLELPKLALDDPQAKALAYHEDASAVDTAQHTRMVAGSNCANCQLYTGATGSEWGPCSIFPGKLVKAQGWCSTWVKKAV